MVFEVYTKEAEEIVRKALKGAGEEFNEYVDENKLATYNKIYFTFEDILEWNIEDKFIKEIFKGLDKEEVTEKACEVVYKDVDIISKSEAERLVYFTSVELFIRHKLTKDYFKSRVIGGDTDDELVDYQITAYAEVMSNLLITKLDFQSATKTINYSNIDYTDNKGRRITFKVNIPYSVFI